MAKKVNPKVIRLGVTRTWHSKWFADKSNYIQRLKQDVAVRRYFIKNFKEAGVDRVEIERNSDNKIFVYVHTAKPGILIGRGGAGIEDLKKKIHKQFLKSFRMNEINLNIVEVTRPNLSAMVMTQSMILDLEKRMPFKRVLKQTIGKAERAGALGIKVMVSGRLNGAEIARTEHLISGKLPLSTLRADIDYARGIASTTFGTIGIKCWIYKGEIFEKTEEKGQVLRENKK
jgi:small subunit ribosomal protein S3